MPFKAKFLLCYQLHYRLDLSGFICIGVLVALAIVVTAVFGLTQMVFFRTSNVAFFFSDSTDRYSPHLRTEDQGLAIDLTYALSRGEEILAMIVTTTPGVEGVGGNLHMPG